MNGGGDSIDESLCPDSFGLDLPLHVWHLLAIIQQLQNTLNLGSREALVTEGCLCVCLYFFKSLSSPWEGGDEKSCVCHYDNLGWGAKTRPFIGASTADTVRDRERVTFAKMPNWYTPRKMYFIANDVRATPFPLRQQSHSEPKTPRMNALFGVRNCSCRGCKDWDTDRACNGGLLAKPKR